MLALFVLVSLAAAAHGFPNSYIIGGKDAPVGAYPHLVSLRKNGSHSCGGSIISTRTVLSAAHCVISYVKDPRVLEILTIHAGTNLLSEEGTVYKAIKAIHHENYNMYKLLNDIGVLILSRPVEFTPTIQPIRLATNDIVAGSPCVLSGWGRTAIGGLFPDKLQHIKLNVYDQKKCQAIFWQVKSSHICTYTRAGEGACHGDSGSPLIAGDVQIGVVSFALPCARGEPDVFTRVSSYTNWLRKNIVL
ncbi:chymotrypsin-1-like [Pseudomyrmex gracilis]|nr:chymotrypsin-1-like [Pseudomyrmex gracilis]